MTTPSGSPSAPLGSFRFSAHGKKLFAFWLAAAAIFVFGWWWRPHVTEEMDDRPTDKEGPAERAEDATEFTSAQPREGSAINSVDDAHEEEEVEPVGFLEKFKEKALNRDDSWTPMRTALDVMHEDPKQPLYSTIFKKELKFQYPPSSLLGFEAWRGAFGEAATTNVVLNLMGVLLIPLLLGSIYFLCRDVLPSWDEYKLDHALPFLFGVFFYPTLKPIEIGQIQTHLNALMGLGVLLFARGHVGASGLVIGIISTIKPQMGLFLLWGLIAKQYRFAAVMGAVAVATQIFALLRYGLPHHLEYIQVLSEISKHGESYYANQSLNGLILRALHLGPNLVWSFTDFAPYSPWVRYPTLVATLAFTTFAMWRFPSSGKDRGLDFSIAAVCFTIGSPIAWEHHYGFMSVVFAVALVAFTRSAAPPWMWRVLAVAWLLTATRIAGTGALADTPLNFVQSHTFFGGVLLLVLLQLARTRLVEATTTGAEGRT